jgi:hypothetical protein
VSLPWLLIGLWLLASRHWTPLMGPLRWIGGVSWARPLLADLNTVQALAPLSLLVAISVVKPALSSYALVTMVPFLIVLMAVGLVRSGRVGAGLATIVLLASFSSVYFTATQVRGRDYKGLAIALAARAEPGDTVLVRSVWWTAPINYYLRAPEFQMTVPPGFEGPPGVVQPKDVALPPRLWILDFGPDTTLNERIAEIAATVPEYVETERVVAHRGGAGLFLKKEDSGR